MNQGIVALCLTVAVTGCSNPEQDNQELRAALDAQSLSLIRTLSNTIEPSTDDTDDLVFKLAFGEEADLDIYVTDPLLETVYFANHASKSGGHINRDVRCESEGPRIEEVRFANPLPGKYRVGVDLPKRCDEKQDSAAYAISVSGRGVNRQIHGVVPLQYFQVVVLEFDLPANLSGDKVEEQTR